MEQSMTLVVHKGRQPKKVKHTKPVKKVKNVRARAATKKKKKG